MNQNGQNEPSVEEEGVVTMVMERMEAQHLPRALDLKAKVDAGAVLDDFDIAFLERVFKDCEEIVAMDDMHPELKESSARLMALYLAITEKALQNERAAAQ